MITTGSWKEGNPGDIISDDLRGINPNEYDYYGGKLIAESVRNPDDRKLIARSKQMLSIIRKLPESPYFKHMQISQEIIQFLKEIEDVTGDTLPREEETSSGKGIY